MGQLTHDDVDYLVAEVRDELELMSSSRYRQVTRSEDSFVTWIREQVYRAARSIGLVISLPFRAVWEAIKGFFSGLFGDS